MSLKLDSLYFFSVLAKSDSLAQAAEELFMSPQALSKNLGNLEREMGQPLIYRYPRGLQRLTPTGKLLYQKTLNILDSIEHLETLFENTGENTENTCIRIGTMLSLDEQVLKCVNAWHDTVYKPSLALFHSMNGLERALLNGELDLAVAPYLPASSDFQGALLARHPYIIIGTTDHHGPWNILPYLSFTGLPDQSDFLNRWPETDYPRHVVGEADFPMAIRLCAMGIGCLHIPEPLFPLTQKELVLDASLHNVCEPPFESHFSRYLIWSTRISEPAYVQAFKQQVIESASNHYERTPFKN